MNLNDSPSFGIDAQSGGIVSDYSDGVPTISYALLKSDGQILRQYDAERVYYSASTVKVGVLIAALREIQNGTWSLDDQLTVSHEFASIVPSSGRFVMEIGETDAGLGAPGDTVSRAHVLNRMTTVSANCATNMCFEALGPAKVQAVFAEAGANDTGMGRPYSDEAGLRAGITNRASALGLARVMAALVRGALLNPEWTRYAMRLLHEREDPVISSIAVDQAARTGEPVYTGGKGGSVDGIKHDVAFIERKGETLCLAVCTRAYSIPQGAAAIGAIANALLDDARARIS